MGQEEGKPDRTVQPQTANNRSIKDLIRYGMQAAGFFVILFLLAGIAALFFQSVTIGAIGLFLAAGAALAAGWLIYTLDHQQVPFPLEEPQSVESNPVPVPEVQPAAEPPVAKEIIEFQASSALDEITMPVSEIGAAVAEMHKEIDLQTAAIQRQMEAVERATTLGNKIWEIVEQFSINAEEASESSKKTVEVSRQGQQSVQEIIHGMSQIKTLVGTITDNLDKLSASSDKIREITAFVGDVTAQSRILSLNASIEAAHAGEYGRGIAVVAQEVRDLADQSQKATVQVKDIVDGIQAAIARAVRAANEGSQGVEVGVRLAGQAGTAIEQLVRVIGQVSRLALNIERASQQQISGIEQVVLMVQNINQEITASQESLERMEQVMQTLGEKVQQLEGITATGCLA